MREDDEDRKELDAMWHDLKMRERELNNMFINRLGACLLALELIGGLIYLVHKAEQQIEEKQPVSNTLQVGPKIENHNVIYNKPAP